jgi:hypothetical protein
MDNRKMRKEDSIKKETKLLNEKISELNVKVMMKINSRKFEDKDMNDLVNLLLDIELVGIMHKSIRSK